ncbi:hypothetical protein [Rhizobium leguminosarum]
MSDTIRRYVSQHPHARATTIQYLAKRDETTERLRQELGMQKSRKPWWRRALSAAFKGKI